jgi:hypothetical protein
LGESDEESRRRRKGEKERRVALQKSENEGETFSEV